MLASNVTHDVLEYAAHAVGVRAEIAEQSGSGLRHRVKLYPIVPPDAWQIDKSRSRRCPVCGDRVRCAKLAKDGRRIGTCGDAAPAARWANHRRWKDERGDAHYQRESAGYGNAGRRVHAVCWHGFRDYFRAVFSKAPDAVFRTAYDTWRGSDDFEARYRESGHRNIGSPIAPVSAAEACRCLEAGLAS